MIEGEDGGDSAAASFKPFNICFRISRIHLSPAC